MKFTVFAQNFCILNKCVLFLNIEIIGSENEKTDILNRNNFSAEKK